MSPGSARAGEQWALGIEVGLGYQGGESSWDAKDVQFPTKYGSVKGDMEATFPVDYMTGQLMLELRRTPVNGAKWALRVSLGANLTDPEEELTVTAQKAGVKLAYTESGVDLEAIAVDLSGLLNVNSWISQRGAFDLNLVLGYRHDYYRFGAFGANGWYLKTPIDADRNDIWIRHKTHRMQPYAGVGLTSRVLKRLVVDTELLMLGFISRDHDDQLAARSHGYGMGVGVNLVPKWELTRPSETVYAITVGLDLNLRYIRAPWGTFQQGSYESDLDITSIVYGAAGVLVILF